VRTFLHLAASPITPEQQTLIEKKLDKAVDWLRYMPGCWLIYTAQPAEVWFERLSGITGLKSGSVFVCEVDLENRSGWLKRSTWDWINKPR
jgi:hypothetical protein